MSLISSSYFIGLNDIPNSEHDDVKSMIDHLIAVYENEYLETMLGYELLKKFNAGVLASNPIYLDLKNGKEFTGLDGRLKKWHGFVDTVTFLSPVADYIYWYYLKRSVTQTAGLGEVTANAQNAANASPKFKMCDAHNRMVEKNKILHEFLTANYTDYPEYHLNSFDIEHYSLLTKINPYGI
jgi:hypothetical protein